MGEMDNIYKPIRDSFFICYISTFFHSCGLNICLPNLSLNSIFDRQDLGLSFMVVWTKASVICKSAGEQGQIQSCYGQRVVPVPRHSGLPRAGIRVTSQHFEGGRLSSSVNSQQTEALTAQKAIRLTHRRWNTLQGGEKDDVRSREPLVSK